MAEPPSSPNAPWPSTVWTLVRDLDKPAHRRMAAETLAARYWRPVYAALRKKGHAHHDAADFTQEFFLALFTRDWALRADQRKGKFRTFLSTLLFRFVRDIEERRQTRFEKSLLNLPFEISEADARLLDWKVRPSPENVFWVQYTRDLLDRVLGKLREEAEAGDGAPDDVSFRVFSRRVEDASEGIHTSWEKLGSEFSMEPHQARYAFNRTAERFKDRLAKELGEEGEEGARLQDAVKELLGFLIRKD